MLDDLTQSRPCADGECDYHSEHRPCELGWIDADTVCPCWSARRRVRINHTDPEPLVTVGTPMPASVRAALHAAKKTAHADVPNTLPWVPKTQTAPAEESPTENDGDFQQLDDRAIQILQNLEVAPLEPTQSLNRLGTAIAAALDRGWSANTLTAHLDNNRGPDETPIRFWIWTLGRIDAHPPLTIAGKEMPWPTPTRSSQAPST